MRRSAAAGRCISKSRAGSAGRVHPWIYAGHPHVGRPVECVRAQLQGDPLRCARLRQVLVADRTVLACGRFQGAACAPRHRQRACRRPVDGRSLRGGSCAHLSGAGPKPDPDRFGADPRIARQPGAGGVARLHRRSRQAGQARRGQGAMAEAASPTTATRISRSICGARSRARWAIPTRDAGAAGGRHRRFRERLQQLPPAFPRADRGGEARRARRRRPAARVSRRSRSARCSSIRPA